MTIAVNSVRQILLRTLLKQQYPTHKTQLACQLTYSKDVESFFDYVVILKICDNLRYLGEERAFYGLSMILSH